MAVNDGNGNTVSQSFSWAVSDTPQGPWLAYPSQQNNKVGDTVSLQMQGGDYDGKTLSYTSGGSLPSGLSINATTGLITGTITGSATTYSVSITASDGTMTATQTFNWNVSTNSSSPVAQVILAVNGTVDPTDDVGFVNPNIAMPVLVTLQNASSGLHQIQLTVTPGKSSLDRSSFQLANGGTTTVMLTALQASQVVDDVVLAAQVDGKAAGDAKVTNEMVTIPTHVRHPDTPKVMEQDRITRYKDMVFSVGLSLSLINTGKSVHIKVINQSVPNGQIVFTVSGTRQDEFDAIGPMANIGIRGWTRTDLGSSGLLKLQASVGKEIAQTSEGFSVAPIPQNFNAKYLDKVVTNQLVGILVLNSWESDSGDITDLDQVQLSEQVEYTSATGVFLGAKGISAGYGSATEFRKDKHLATANSLKAPGGEALANQLYIFKDNRTGATDIAASNSGFNISRVVAKGADGIWRITVSKVGADVKANRFESKKATTEPAKGITKVLP